MNRPFDLPGYSRVLEPTLRFHPEREADRDVHPLLGLLRFGPFSRSLINAVIDPIRVATIYPAGFRKRVERLFSELEQHQVPRERKNYLPAFPGFARVFGLRAIQASDDLQLELSAAADREVMDSSRPHVRLAELLTKAVNQLLAFRSEFDVLLILLPDKWSPAFYGEEDDFDLHDYMKAVNASRGIPTQLVQEASALSYPCRASVMWRLSIALYCKAGGVPWKLSETDPESAYIGLSYALRPDETGKQRFVTCCSQVFDSDGAGLEFVAYETDDVNIRVFRENPFLNRSEMRRLMARSLALYQRRHGGRSPRRVTVHKTTEFKPEEVDGCFDAWPASEGIELYQIQQESLWSGVLIDPPKSKTRGPGVASAFPCERGTYLQLGAREFLVWTQGNVREALGGANFYKEGKNIPQPLVLKRFAGHGSWHEQIRGVLGLTKMNWNNDSLYDRLPVTLSYASTLARTIKRMPTIHSRPYEFRFFM
jgi:hypothetical protein